MDGVNPLWEANHKNILLYQSVSNLSGFENQSHYPGMVAPVINKDQSFCNISYASGTYEKLYVPATQSQVSNNDGRLPMPCLPPDLPFHCFSMGNTNTLVKNSSESIVCTPQSDRFQKLNTFLDQLKIKKPSSKKEKEVISVAAFVSTLKNSFSVLDELSNRKLELNSLLQAEDKIWNQKIKHIIKLQNILCELLSIVSCPELLKKISTKLEGIKKKRLRLKRLKRERASLKEADKEKRLKLHSDIDHFYDVLKEKDLQRKREDEMKKEVDYILSEVRKKVKEAKNALEKLKVFEKLRRVRKDHAAEKGVLILPLHDRNFDKKVSEMKEMLVKRLFDYENEEKALKVMLETEQEDQLKTENKWHRKRIKEIQDKKHRNFATALFGDEDSKVENQDMFLFHDFYDAGNKSVNNLVQIRHDWDIYLVPADDRDGSSIPQQWVTPSLPSNDVWQTALPP